MIKHMRINAKSRSPCNWQSFRMGVEPPLGGSLPNHFKYKACEILDFCCAAVDFCRISWHLKMRPTSSPIKSVTNYPFTLRTVAEEQKISSDLVIADVFALWPVIEESLSVSGVQRVGHCQAHVLKCVSLCPGFGLQYVYIQFSYLKSLKPRCRLVQAPCIFRLGFILYYFLPFRAIINTLCINIQFAPQREHSVAVVKRQFDGGYVQK